VGRVQALLKGEAGQDKGWIAARARSGIFALHGV